MDVDAPLRFGAPGNPPPPNPPEPAALIGLGASLLPLPPKQGGKNPSIVWKHFIKLASIDPKTQRSECKYCKNQYNCHGKKNGTSGMLHHKEECKKWHFPRDDKQKTLSFQAKRERKSGSNVLVVANYSEERTRLALAMMIIIDELPFKFMECHGFQEFMKIVESRLPIPHRTSIARACMKIYSGEMDILRRDFVGQRIYVTTDTWTSIQSLNYMVVIAHFIDVDWTYQKKTLNFYPIANYKRDTIGRVVELCLLKWGIDRLFTITMDNASSNDMTIDYVKKKTK